MYIMPVWFLNNSLESPDVKKLELNLNTNVTFITVAEAEDQDLTPV